MSIFLDIPFTGGGNAPTTTTLRGDARRESSPNITSKEPTSRTLLYVNLGKHPSTLMHKKVPGIPRPRIGFLFNQKPF
jgi:hypothetical protein